MIQRLNNEYACCGVVEENLLSLPVIALLVRIHDDHLTIDHKERVQPGAEKTSLTERESEADLVLNDGGCRCGFRWLVARVNVVQHVVDAVVDGFGEGEGCESSLCSCSVLCPFSGGCVEWVAWVVGLVAGSIKCQSSI